MENTLLFVVVSILTIPRNVEGICINTGGSNVTDVTSGFVTTDITGSAKGGFSIKCEFVSANSYSLYLWQLKILNGVSSDTVFSYFVGTTPPTVGPGSGYMDRGLTFENNNTVVFPNFTTTDVTKKDFECTIQLNTAAVICKETKKLNIFATPVTSIEHDSWKDRFPIGSSQVLKISGSNYLPGSATFRTTIGNQNSTLSAATTDEDNGFKRFTSQVSFEVPDGKSLKVDTFMNVDGSEVLIYSITYDVYEEPVFLLVLVIVVTVVTIVVLIVACKSSGKKKVQIAALLVTIIGAVISVIIILLMIFLYRNSKYFIANVTLGALDIAVAVAVAVTIKIRFRTAKK